MKITISWSLFLLSSLSMVLAKLWGENICTSEETFKFNDTEYIGRNATVRDYKWCVNIPPRCSYYKIKEFIEKRNVEREGKKQVEKCCPGYRESEIHTCVSICKSCINGKCVNNTCVCEPGFVGDDCSSACEPMRWGLDCRFHCMCERGSCSTTTGNCICPTGWIGTRCESECPDGFFGLNCTQKCECPNNFACKTQDGTCIYSTTETPIEDSKEKHTSSTRAVHYIDGDSFGGVTLRKNSNPELRKNPSLQKYHTFDDTPTETSVRSTTTRNRVKVKVVDPSLEHSKIYFANNGGFQPEIDQQGKRVINLQTIVSSNSTETTSPRNVKPNTSSSVVSRNNTDGTDFLVQSFEERNDSLDDYNFISNYKNKLIIHILILVVFGTVLLILFVFITIWYHRSGKKSKSHNHRTRVSVYTQHSIFHTPLPEPPTTGPIETPIFLKPLEFKAHSNDKSTTYETKIVCNMNFQNVPKQDPKEYLYDHPPSTGSYRAASIPEPPDVDIQSLNQLGLEPLYDEIPSSKRKMVSIYNSPPPSYKSADLYMNTMERNKF